MFGYDSTYKTHKRHDCSLSHLFLCTRCISFNVLNMYSVFTKGTFVPSEFWKYFKIEIMIGL